MKVLTALAFALLVGAAQAAPIRPFTLDTVMEDLRVTHPEASRVSEALPPGVEAHEELTYAQPDGQPLGLDLYRPATKAICPAVILVHGGGWLSGDRRMERTFAKQLAARGYVAVPVSYRLGTPGRFPAPIHDLKAAIRWLRAHHEAYGIDPAHIGAAGGSAGGTLATFIGASNNLASLEGDLGNPQESSAVQAVVNIDGSVNFMDNQLIQSSETKPSPYWEYVHGLYRDHRDVWIAASPLFYIGPQSAPTFFIKSTAKTPILAGRDEMSARLKIFGIDSGIIQIPNTPHPFWLVHPWFEQVLDLTDQFMARHLKG